MHDLLSFCQLICLCAFFYFIAASTVVSGFINLLTGSLSRIEQMVNKLEQNYTALKEDVQSLKEDIQRKWEMVKTKQDMVLIKQDLIHSTLRGETSVHETPLLFTTSPLPIPAHNQESVSDIRQL